MRVLILADALFAARERGLISRLEIGLADEGVSVVHALPERLADGGGQDVYARFVTYASQTNFLTKSIAVRKLAADIASLGDSLDARPGIDLVHVYGGNAWSFGAAFAREMGVPLVVEVWRPGLAERVATLRAGDIPGVAAIAPDPAIARALHPYTTHCQIIAAPWGVLCDDPREILPVGRAPAIVVVGSGRNVRAYAPMLRGLAPVAAEFPDTMVFCDARAARNSELWAHARGLDLLKRLSLVENLEARRDLVLQADVLVHPESQGEQRSVVLEAMAGCMVVVAARDPLVEVLREGATARLVDAGDAKAWEHAFRATLAHRDESNRLGRSAHDYVRSHRTASAYIGKILACYGMLARAPRT